MQHAAFGGNLSLPVRSGRLIYRGRRMDGKKRFCPLLGLRPKGGAARHPCSIVLNMAAPHTWERFGCQTIDSILLPDTRQGKIRFRKRNAFRNAGRRLACEDFFRLATCRRQATYFFKREKVGKKRFSRLSGRGKRNRRRFRRRGSACVINSPAGRARAFASYRNAIFMGHSV